MIHFECRHCGRKLKVPDECAGRQGRCPSCKGMMTVPASLPESAAAQDIQLVPADTTRARVEAALDLPQPVYTDEDREEARREDRRLLTRLGIEPLPEYTGERKLPWPIDILLYPANGMGLTILALPIGIPLLRGLLSRFVPGIALRMLGLPMLILSLVAGLYINWYMVECVYDSAKGGTRAPQAFANWPSLGEAWSRVSYVLAVYIIYLFPAVFYGMFFGRLDSIFWTLSGWAILFFPIGVLAMVINDSISALNPIFLLGSIFRVFFQYIGLITLILPLAGLFWLLGRSPEDAVPSIVRDAAGLIMTSYIPFIFAHVLGRFYWRNRERLDWGI